MLKFRKDPFRGVDGIDSKMPLQNRCRRHIGGGQLWQNNEEDNKDRMDADSRQFTV